MLVKLTGYRPDLRPENKQSTNEQNYTRTMWITNKKCLKPLLFSHNMRHNEQNSQMSIQAFKQNVEIKSSITGLKL